MSEKSAALLDAVEVKPLKCALRKSERVGVALQKVESGAGDLVDAAISGARMTRDTAAREMGISPSLLTRQIQNTDNQHLSFQRLWSTSMPMQFKVALLLAMAEDLGIEVETTVRIRRTA